MFSLNTEFSVNSFFTALKKSSTFPLLSMVSAKKSVICTVLPFREVSLAVFKISSLMLVFISIVRLGVDIFGFILFVVHSVSCRLVSFVYRFTSFSTLVQFSAFIASCPLCSSFSAIPKTQSKNLSAIAPVVTEALSLFLLFRVGNFYPPSSSQTLFLVFFTVLLSPSTEIFISGIFNFWLVLLCIFYVFVKTF